MQKSINSNTFPKQHLMGDMNTAFQSNFDDNAHFTLSNIPFGVVSLKTETGPRHIATRLYGDVYLLPQLLKEGLLRDIPQDAADTLREPTLNQFTSLSLSTCKQVCKHSKFDVIHHLPVKISDFTDFSCSMHHLSNASEAMTGKRTMPPCFFHFPPGYSGRCSSIVPSRTPIRRPLGQHKGQDGQVIYGPTQQLDFELEVAAVIGQSTKFGEPVNADNAERHVFGLMLLDDWSARDIQFLEMPPLGPLNGKSLGTTLSPWVVTLDALQPFLCSALPHDLSVEAAPYLRQTVQSCHYDIATRVGIVRSGVSSTVCKSNFRDLYWSLSSLVAHQTSNGCSLNTGDLLGTGTISGPASGSYGCLMESTKGGKQELELGNGEKLTYLHDGDAVRLSAWSGDIAWHHSYATVMQQFSPSCLS